ncbi:MAG: hypothetical protein M1831_004828 [Alyxoria varia]|nr:MAG: hypothetical protein M1831_004828 [Alyxoria varia]
MSENGAYSLAAPVDPDEHNRLDIQHRIWLIEHDGALHRATLDDSKLSRVLDVGCGTGIWAADFAREHPQTHVTGVDISPPRPEPGSVPNNCKFVEADANGDWQFAREDAATAITSTAAGPYDFINVRVLVNAIRDWPRFFAQCYRHLSSNGGILEIADCIHCFYAEDETITSEKSAMMRWWNQLFRRISEANGIDCDAPKVHAQRAKEAGFVDVDEKWVKWYCGGGGGSTGAFTKPRGKKDEVMGGMALGNRCGLVRTVTGGAVRNGALPKGMGKNEANELADSAVRDMKEMGDQRGYYLWFVIITGKKA